MDGRCGHSQKHFATPSHLSRHPPFSPSSARRGFRVSMDAVCPHLQARLQAQGITTLFPVQQVVPRDPAPHAPHGNTRRGETRVRGLAVGWIPLLEKDVCKKISKIKFMFLFC